MKRVLVTGASGLIGRLCLPRLKSSGFEVHAITRHAPTDPQDIKWHAADLQSPGTIEQILMDVQPSHLLHLAWYTTPGQFWSSDQNRAWLNTSIDLFRAFRSHGGTRILATGTCAEYDWTNGLCDERTTPCCPGTLYGRAKLATGTYLNALNDSEGMITCWARLFFLYGPGASPLRMPGVVVEALRNGKSVECSAGTQRRDFLYVEDAADALTRLVESDITGSINICSGQSIAIREIAEQTAALLGRPDLLKLGAKPDSASEPMLVVGSQNRLRTELNWQPRFSIDDGLQAYVQHAML